MTTLLSDDFLTIGSMSWGDFVPPSPPSEASTESFEATSVATFEEDALSGWTVPDLRLRKNIWENFPVNVNAVRSPDCTERYALTWNSANLRTWRTERANSYEEAMEYELYCEIRLLHALQQHSRWYVVEPPQNESQICILAMVHGTDSDASTVSTNDTPVLRSVKDIRKHFPVNWKQEGNVVRLEFHRMNLRASGVTESDMRDRLLEAVNASNAWKVRVATAPFLCELVLHVEEEVPILKTISDVRKNFPVNWKQEGNVFRLEFHRMNLRASGKTESVVRESLLKAVRASDAWTVCDAPAPFLCDLVLV